MNSMFRSASHLRAFFTVSQFLIPYRVVTIFLLCFPSLQLYQTLALMAFKNSLCPGINFLETKKPLIEGL
jgi:hypothetical protein